MEYRREASWIACDQNGSGRKLSSLAGFEAVVRYEKIVVWHSDPEPRHPVLLIDADEKHPMVRVERGSLVVEELLD